MLNANGVGEGATVSTSLYICERDERKEHVLLLILDYLRIR